MRGLAALVVILLFSCASAPEIDVSVGEFILGEQPLGQSAGDAAAFAQQMFDEADRLWRSDGWKKETERNGILVESKPVAGPFAPSGIRVMRSRGVLSASADEVFALLVSPEGFALLDPMSDKEDHKLPPLQSYPWRKGARLEAALARAKVPFLGDVEFVVLNAIDPATRTFVSKSVLHPAHPTNGKTRGINTMALRLNDLGNGTSEFLLINYIEMGLPGGGVPWLFDVINRDWFAPIYQRTERHFTRLPFPYFLA